MYFAHVLGNGAFKCAFLGLASGLGGSGAAQAAGREPAAQWPWFLELMSSPMPGRPGRFRYHKHPKLSSQKYQTEPRKVRSLDEPSRSDHGSLDGAEAGRSPQGLPAEESFEPSGCLFPAPSTHTLVSCCRSHDFEHVDRDGLSSSSRFSWGEWGFQLFGLCRTLFEDYLDRA